jgi:hypothetical protein
MLISFRISGCNLSSIFLYNPFYNHKRERDIRLVPEGFKRKLTAILNADVEGYGCSNRENGETTLHILNTNLETTPGLIQ